MVRIIKKSREIYLTGEIDHFSAGDAISAILYFNSKAKASDPKDMIQHVEKPITLYINSVGGSIYDAWGLIDVIENSELPVNTVCTGYAMSAGLLIFLAGKTRSVTKHATLMYHQLSAFSFGKFADISDEFDELKILQSQIEKYVSSKTKIPISKLHTNRDNKKDWFIRADQAVSLGIADQII